MLLQNILKCAFGGCQGYAPNIENPPCLGEISGENFDLWNFRLLFKSNGLLMRIHYAKGFKALESFLKFPGRDSLAKVLFTASVVNLSNSNLSYLYFGESGLSKDQIYHLEETSSTDV